MLDTAGSSAFWQMVDEMARYDPAADVAAIEERTRHIEFEAGAQPNTATEHYNMAPVMAPGELDELVASLVADFARHPGNDPALVRQYIDLLDRFRRDWRQAYLQDGLGQRGWPIYRELIDRALAGLQPDRRALLTSTNQVGVNPIIVQRILKSALATEHYATFVANDRPHD